MKNFLTVLLAIGLGFAGMERVGAQQIQPQAQSHVVPTKTVTTKTATNQTIQAQAADPSDRVVRQNGADMLAVTSASVEDAADLNLIVTPSDQFYPDSTIRDPFFFRSDRFEAGIMGRPFPEVYRTNNLRSLFPIDDEDASTQIAVYVQANF